MKLALAVLALIKTELIIHESLAFIWGNQQFLPLFRQTKKDFISSPKFSQGGDAFSEVCVCVCVCVYQLLSIRLYPPLPMQMTSSRLWKALAWPKKLPGWLAQD